MRKHLIVLSVLISACAPKDAQLQVQAPSTASTAPVAAALTVRDTTPVAQSETLTVKPDTIPRKFPSEAELLTWRHLFPPDSFPQLTKAARVSLNARHCQIPSPEKKPLNVVFGAFTAKSAVEWALLCSVRDTSQLLVINASGAVVDSMEKSPDANWIQSDVDNTWLFSEQLQVIPMLDLNDVPADTTADDVVYYGAWFPKPIDHDAIDIAFLGKASTTYYSSKGKWYSVQSSD